MVETEQNQKKDSINFLYILAGLILIAASFLFTQFFVFSEDERVIPDFNQVKSFLKIDKKKVTTEVDNQLVGNDEQAEANNVTNTAGENIENAAFNIQILDYPKEVENICQEFEITMKIKNLGDKPLTYNDIVEDGNYFLDLTSKEMDEDRPYLNTVKKDNGSKITDFGTLEPGDEAEITYLAADKVEFIDADGNVKETRLDNPFSNIDKNGTYNLRVEIGSYEENNKDVVLGQSNYFPVEVEVMLSDDIFKGCN
jgi:hypothetical protein